MATTSGFVNQTGAGSAPRTCIPCKSSKKKCDKTLPMLDLPCTYDDAAETVQDITAKSQAILDRLERLESRVFASEEQQTTVAPDHRANSNIEVKEAQENIWQLKPSLLHPSYLGMIAAMNLATILEEKSTTARQVGKEWISEPWKHKVSKRTRAS
ncbi:hypothetical protein N7453_000213 [Penicillium expansum]|nr:hypothetical protein N7453_000213 [Penicillium expansum]